MTKNDLEKAISHSVTLRNSSCPLFSSPWTQSLWGNIFIWTMDLKRPFVCDTFCCAHSLFGSPCRQSISAHSFSWKMFLKRVFITDTVEDPTLHIHYLGLLGDTAHQVDTIILLARCSWKYCLQVTLVKPLHVHSGLPGDQTYQLDMIVLLRIWSWKAICQWHKGSLCL